MVGAFESEYHARRRCARQQSFISRKRILARPSLSPRPGYVFRLFQPRIHRGSVATSADGLSASAYHSVSVTKRVDRKC